MKFRWKTTGLYCNSYVKFLFVWSFYSPDQETITFPMRGGERVRPLIGNTCAPLHGHEDQAIGEIEYKGLSERSRHLWLTPALKLKRWLRFLGSLAPICRRCSSPALWILSSRLNFKAFWGILLIARFSLSCLCRIRLGAVSEEAHGAYVLGAYRLTLYLGLEKQFFVSLRPPNWLLRPPLVFCNLRNLLARKEPSCFEEDTLNLQGMYL